MKRNNSEQINTILKLYPITKERTSSPRPQINTMKIEHQGATQKLKTQFTMLKIKHIMNIGK